MVAYLSSNVSPSPEVMSVGPMTNLALRTVSWIMAALVFFLLTRFIAAALDSWLIGFVAADLAAIITVSVYVSISTRPRSGRS